MIIVSDYIVSVVVGGVVSIVTVVVGAVVQVKLRRQIETVADITKAQHESTRLAIRRDGDRRRMTPQKHEPERRQSWMDAERQSRSD